MTTRSAAKAHRQSVKRRLRNRAVRSACKTAINKADAAIAAGDFEAGRQAVRLAISTLDRAASKDVFHPNTVSRRKSRLLLKFNAAVAAQAVTAEPTVQEKKPPKPRARTRRKKSEE